MKIKNIKTYGDFSPGYVQGDYIVNNIIHNYNKKDFGNVLLGIIELKDIIRKSNYDGDYRLAYSAIMQYEIVKSKINLTFFNKETFSAIDNEIQYHSLTTFFYLGIFDELAGKINCLKEYLRKKKCYGTLSWIIFREKYFKFLTNKKKLIKSLCDFAYYLRKNKYTFDNMMREINEYESEKKRYIYTIAHIYYYISELLIGEKEVDLSKKFYKRTNIIEGVQIEESVHFAFSMNKIHVNQIANIDNKSLDEYFSLKDKILISSNNSSLLRLRLLEIEQLLKFKNELSPEWKDLIYVYTKEAFSLLRDTHNFIIFNTQFYSLIKNYKEIKNDYIYKYDELRKEVSSIKYDWLRYSKYFKEGLNWL